MLVLSRKQDEKIIIGDSITLMVISIQGDKVRLGIEAPKHVSIHREEVYQAIQREYQGETWLFESKTGKPLNPNNVGHQVRKAGQRIGVTSYSPHMLRHARATDMLLRKGMSLKAVSICCVCCGRLAHEPATDARNHGAER